ncbi:putative folC bifunctional folylpolyglutamate synthase and dihydrofolate synthase, containing Mur ligase domain [Magnetospirillum gryphiswaldense MSR-1 v2]|uniref:Dihydrofolate synthase/folylpolyglutamate synthase n=1 Tax=Magnetospirillum gryphiswaldense (strain DSM 6361 / JCM 21280 / NBRC 15271 / MSR-1) TaxID=431944 RepID=V6F0G8_MAGGM|nr:folylpolyglutamate synthase/dihydrofolate synthase family protein [Magnetospirillum gryphiswaldense]CDK98959.1 putative folC bifunctional folylpolyglutamate synthase and dihydrofolate synthase, containing Mur ligase domain [Magnetospirillum gryphiswaldense MSR-1 v2]
MIDAVLERLTRLHPKVIDLSLDRVLTLLDKLGHPQTRLPPVIHVAGTNGKGSTVAFLRAFAEAAGLRTHVYTSPHLVRFAERIRVAGQIIDDASLLALLEEIEQVNASDPITFFEITTAAAFLAFSRTPADLVILETGLGGRLDATNVVERPALTVITPIAMDHESFLGGRIEAIAAEKAGIMKRGIACIVADQGRKVAKVLEARSLEMGVPLLKEGNDFFARATPDGGTLYKGVSLELTLPAPGLTGSFQMRNAGLALAALERLSRGEKPPVLAEIPPAAFALGMKSVEWPARLQRLTKGPLVEMLPAGWELYLDGGHNPHAAEAIARHARSWRDMPLMGVFGILANKDIDGYMGHMATRFHSLRTVTIPGEPSALPAEAAAACATKHFCMDAKAVTSVEAALRDLVGGHAGPARVLICGSLYLAGTVLADNS